MFYRSLALKGFIACDSFHETRTRVGFDFNVAHSEVLKFYYFLNVEVPHIVDVIISQKISCLPLGLSSQVSVTVKLKIRLKQYCC